MEKNLPQFFLFGSRSLNFFIVMCCFFILKIRANDELLKSDQSKFIYVPDNQMKIAESRANELQLESEELTYLQSKILERQHGLQK